MADKVTPIDGSRGKVAAFDAVDNLGSRLRTVRQRSGLSLRSVARQLGVSASFVSQLENGKSQPSVATLYSLTQLLDTSIDELFETGAGRDGPAPPAGDEIPVSRSSMASPADAWPLDGSLPRLSVTQPGDRTRLVMDSGVIWEQLARNTGHDLDFMEIIYPPGSSSTNDDRMLRHEGYEFGYLLEGELEVTFGFDVFMLRAGQGLGLDSSVPHLFKNLGTVPARGIWCVQHRRP
jgi:transcriptional regulator with XRE-family HTH domain/mannose-6-phosphate isomerase-like protein (cupin superfamily)